MSLAGIINIYGQNKLYKVVVEVKKVNRKKNIITKVEVSGVSGASTEDTAMQSYIEKNFNASKALGKHAKKGKYIVAVKYIISKDGIISDVKCANDPGYETCGELLRIIKRKTKWLPGKVNNYRR